MPPGQSGSVHCLRRGSDPGTLLGPDVYLAPAGLWVMGSQNPRNGGPLLLPLPHPLVSPLQCPHHGATQPLLPAGAPAAPKLNTGAALSQPGHRAMGGLQKGLPPSTPSPGTDPTRHRAREQASPPSYQHRITWPTAVRVPNCPFLLKLRSWRWDLPATLSSFLFMRAPTLWLLFAEVPPPALLPGSHTHRVLKPSRPRNMALRMDSSWLAVRCSSLTEAAPSKAPSSISDTLLLLRLLEEEVAGR